MYVQSLVYPLLMVVDQHSLARWLFIFARRVRRPLEAEDPICGVVPFLVSARGYQVGIAAAE